MKVLVALTTVAGLQVVPAIAAADPVTVDRTPCSISIGGISPGGDLVRQVVFAVNPIQTHARKVLTKAAYPAGGARLAGAATTNPDAMPGLRQWQYVVLNDTMYHSSTDEDPNNVDPQLRKVGAGWGGFRLFETTRYHTNDGVRTYQYALRNDGTLVRWSMRGLQWTNKRTAPGFQAVKSWALISQTATYETFLANTHGGALYTIRIPLTTALKPVVRKVRTSTWQAFESLQIRRCGKASTILVGIDKDTRSAYVYAVGHANGPATPIKAMGRSTAAFADPVSFQWLTYPAGEPPFGE